MRIIVVRSMSVIKEMIYTSRLPAHLHKHTHIGCSKNTDVKKNKRKMWNGIKNLLLCQGGIGANRGKLIARTEVSPAKNLSADRDLYVFTNDCIYLSEYHRQVAILISFYKRRTNRPLNSFDQNTYIIFPGKVISQSSQTEVNRPVTINRRLEIRFCHQRRLMLLLD